MGDSNCLRAVATLLLHPKFHRIFTASLLILICCDVLSKLWLGISYNEIVWGEVRPIPLSTPIMSSGCTNQWIDSQPIPDYLCHAYMVRLTSIDSTPAFRYSGDVMAIHQDVVFLASGATIMLTATDGNIEINAWNFISSCERHIVPLVDCSIIIRSGYKRHLIFDEITGDFTACGFTVRKRQITSDNSDCSMSIAYLDSEHQAVLINDVSGRLAIPSKSYLGFIVQY
jgi:hypothetical protein